MLRKLAILLALLLTSGITCADKVGDESVESDNPKDLKSAGGEDYPKWSMGTRKFELDTDTGIASVKILIDDETLIGSNLEIAEIYFPPGYEGASHVHELEIFYILEGELGHEVNGESYTLTEGSVGIVRAPDRVIHKTVSAKGVRALVIWPQGQEVKNFQGLRETPIVNTEE